MTFNTVLPIWQAVQQRFHKTVKSLSEQELALQIGSSSIASLVRHNAEVEFMFAEWFFGMKMPEGLKDSLDGQSESEKAVETVEQLDKLLTTSNAHLTEAMRSLPEEAWNQSVESRMGPSTPLEAIGRLMYHTGIHAGQIALIRKQNS